MRPIQSLAPAFLQLLGLKNNGALPPELAEFVQPVVDMQPWYLRGNAIVGWRTTAGAFGVATNGLVIPTLDPFAVAVGALQVPANEFWYLHEAAGRIITGFTANAEIVGCATAAEWIQAGGTGHYDVSESTPQMSFALAAGAAREILLNPLKGRWLFPGTRLGVHIGVVELDVGVPFEVTLSARWTPIRF